MADSNTHTWHWQAYGTSWKWVAIYHVSFNVNHTLPDRKLLGKLRYPELGTLGEIRQNSLTEEVVRKMTEEEKREVVEKAVVERSELGKAVVRCISRMGEVFSQIRLLRYMVMETHVHFIVYVTEEMPVGIEEVMRRFWRSCQKEARLLVERGVLERPLEVRQNGTACGGGGRGLGTAPGSATKKTGLGDGRGNATKSVGTMIFPEAPFLRPLSRKGQLEIMMQYVEKNPARLATKRVYKEYFQTMRDVEVAGRRYDAVGNMAILLEERARTVHVHMRWSDEYRDTGRCEALRTYKNECVLEARDGVVLVSPYVNPHEKQVLEVALAEGHKAIVILTHGMTDYYQPAEWLREACANGQVLMLTPWSKEQQEDVGRREFVQLNGMADEIVEWYGGRV